MSLGTSLGSWSLRNMCDASGYSMTSWVTPFAVSAESSRAAAPRKVRSLPPKLPTIGHDPLRKVSASLGTVP